MQEHATSATADFRGNAPIARTPDDLRTPDHWNRRKSRIGLAKHVALERPRLRRLPHKPGLFDDLHLHREQHAAA
jgi:hypothetical protein